MTGIIVEPIQAEGGDHHGSNAWFQVVMIIMIRIIKSCSLNIEHFFLPQSRILLTGVASIQIEDQQSDCYLSGAPELKILISGSPRDLQKERHCLPDRFALRIES